jgi:hypothetical protein
MVINELNRGGGGGGGGGGEGEGEPSDVSLASMDANHLEQADPNLLIPSTILAAATHSSTVDKACAAVTVSGATSPFGSRPEENNHRRFLPIDNVRRSPIASDNPSSKSRHVSDRYSTRSAIDQMWSTWQDVGLPDDLDQPSNNGRRVPRKPR